MYRPAVKGNWEGPRLALEISCEGPGLQGRAVRGDQACRGQQLGTNRLAGEQLSINQAGRGVISG